MSTHTLTDTTKAVVDAFVALQESNRGTELTEVLTEDAVLDLNPPQWRFQIQGARAIAGAFAQSFTAGYRTVGVTWEPTPSGAVVEYDGWDTANDLYFRHLAVLKIRNGEISRLTIYCTGGWDHEAIETQRREAPMVDADARTGALR